MFADAGLSFPLLLLLDDETLESEDLWTVFLGEAVGNGDLTDLSWSRSGILLAVAVDGVSCFFGLTRI